MEASLGFEFYAGAWKMRLVLFLLVVLTITGFVQFQANAAGEPQAGAKLAKEVCARCHDVAPGGGLQAVSAELCLHRRISVAGADLRSDRIAANAFQYARK